MITPVIVIVHEGIDVGLEVARQIVVLQQHPVLHRLMPALNLALRHRMVRPTSGVCHLLVFEPVSQLVGDVARAIVGEQPRAVSDGCAIEP